MAKTDGRGNPPWTRDEILLALDLFFDEGMVALSDTHPKVISLSDQLRGLPGNEDRAKNPKFRNAAGVSFKLSNLASISTGRGFANGSSADRAVWAQFESRPQRVKDVAALIIKYVVDIPLGVDEYEDEEEFAEGRVLTRAHRRIERNSKLRSKLIRERRNANLLRCDACLTTNPTADARLDDAIFDAHHLVPLSTQGSTTTRLHDVALLCANCHRLIHRLIATSGGWRTVKDLRNALND
jgi:5-methylcytosine-specific restriction protein A